MDTDPARILHGGLSVARRRRGFGQIRRLPSRRWQAFYTGPDSQLHYAPVTFETAEDGEAWLVGERRLVASGSWTSPLARAVIARDEARRRQENVFASYATSWLNSRHHLRPSTRSSYRTAIQRHLIPAFGDTAMDAITAEMVRHWFASYGDRTPTARAHAYQVLSSIMADAEGDEVISRSPCRVKAGHRTRALREPEVLTLRELLELAEHMPRRHRALTLLCGLSGLRFGEAVALRRRDIDLEAGALTVVRTYTKVDGKKTTGDPKTRESRRTVAMPLLVVNMLRDHLQQQGIRGRDALVFPGQDGDLLSPTALYGRSRRVEVRGGRRYAKSAYGFYAARDAIGKQTLHWHDLRRTAATLGAQSGATVREMQARLGHATPAMALHYQQATVERDRLIAQRLQDQIENLKASTTERVSGEAG